MPYVSVAIEGGLFPPDLLERIAAGDISLPEQRANDFGLNGTRRLTDEIQSAFSDARSYWDAFHRRLERSHESRTTITREDWVAKFMELLGFEDLIVQRSSAEAGTGRYFISHRVGDYPDAPPIHIVSIEQSLDRRDSTGRRSPHGLVQEYLNHSDVLWGIVTNGKQIRLLRNIARLSKPTYLEFNLEGIMAGNLYSEFVLLYRLLHKSRLPKAGTDAHECLLEHYYQQGIDEGSRVREKLRDGVEEALRILGTALLSHPRSEQLRYKFERNALNAQDYYRQLLRLVYRLLFLMVAEERKLIFPVEEADTERQLIYTRYYGVSRLRDKADRFFVGDSNIDLWLALCQTFLILRDNIAAKHLSLSALNGELFSHLSCPDLEGAACTNDSLLKALRELSTFQDERGIRRRVNYAGLDVEEFGSVYESLLDFHPQVTIHPPQFNLIAGSERKQTGSYYTPPELVYELVESALVPVMQDHLRSLKTHDEQEAALLDLRVCDPASGSGHFLLAAGRRIARELATIRSNGQEPSPEEYRRALRDVIRTCVYAVDKNPLAVDLCKVALWIEGHSAGLPLSFLDHHIKCGDSLVGIVDLKVLDKGIPDEAYKPVIGDDRQAATYYKRRNQEEKKRVRQLYMGESKPIAKITDSLADEFEVLGTLEERTPDEVNTKEDLYNSLRQQDSDWWKLKVACDLWTAAFFMPLKQEDALHMEGVPTTGTTRMYSETDSAHPVLIGQVVATSEEHRFFHWKLEFPDVFERGGFDVVLGNPPWERIKLQEKEFFAARDPEIAGAPNKAARERLIKALPGRDPTLAEEFGRAKHRSEADSKFLKAGERFPLTGKGDINAYSVFAETARNLLSARGRLGMIVPSGIATDDTTKDFFADLVEQRALVSLYDFENREGIFSETHRSYKFCLLTLASTERPCESAEFAFFLHHAQQLREDERRFSLTQEDFRIMNPNTLTCPIFRTKRDADITKRIYKCVPIFINEKTGENPWRISYLRTFDVTNDRDYFEVADTLQNKGFLLDGNCYVLRETVYLPIYEGKMMQQFDHRAASVIFDNENLIRTAQPEATQHEYYADPNYLPMPLFWLKEEHLIRMFSGLPPQDWLVALKKVTSPTNERTLISTLLPRVGCVYSLNVFVTTGIEVKQLCCLYGNLNSFVLDYVARQKIGGVNMAHFIINQLPILIPSNYTPEWLALIQHRVLELTYTAWDLRPFAQDMAYDGPPFRWDEERRFLLRCELDAAFFHLYGVDRDDMDYIMDTFPIVKRKDEERYGEYLTKRTILEIYDDMSRAMRTGQLYQTRLDPPPADPRVSHPLQGR